MSNKSGFEVETSSYTYDVENKFNPLKKYPDEYNFILFFYGNRI